MEQAVADVTAAQARLIETVKAAQAEGVPLTVIARQAGVHRKTVYRWLNSEPSGVEWVRKATR